MSTTTSTTPTLPHLPPLHQRRQRELRRVNRCERQHERRLSGAVHSVSGEQAIVRGSLRVERTALKRTSSTTATNTTMTGKSGMRVHVTHAACSTATTESMAMVSLLRMNGAASGVPVRGSGGREGKGDGREGVGSREVAGQRSRGDAQQVKLYRFRFIHISSQLVGAHLRRIVRTSTWRTCSAST